MLEAEHVRVRYGNGALGITDVSFQLRAGCVTAMFGPNGAGKTTSARAASGFMKTEGARVEGGTIRFEGQDVTNVETQAMARHGVILVPERNKIFPNLSVMDNLQACGRSPARVRRAQLLDQIFDLFPDLRGRTRELAGRLSGGQRQMLAIGRGIFAQPKVLIVDEVSLGLHHSVLPDLFGALTQLAGSGVAVFAVDESPGLVLGLAKHCYVISGGRTTQDGPAADFAGRELEVAGYED